MRKTNFVAFKIDDALLARMKAHCKKEGITPSLFMRTLVEVALMTPDERLKPLKAVEAEYRQTLEGLVKKLDKLIEPEELAKTVLRALKSRKS
jgi:antitoxin component of RelBE/YafQ-DinJ toxin-antitoxin module